MSPFYGYLTTIIIIIFHIISSKDLNQIIAQQLTSSCDRVRFVSRNSWSAHSTEGQVQALTTVPFRVFIHQAWDGQTCQDIDSCIIRVKSIQAYNMFDKGWPDISYNFLIAGNGAVFEGLGWGIRGFHTLNYNEESLGIAFIGTFQDVYPNARMEQALRDLLDCGVQRGLLDANYLLHGHRDARCTICPGNALYSRLATFPRFQRGPLQRYSCPFNGVNNQPQISVGTGIGVSPLQSTGLSATNPQIPSNILNQMLIKDNADRTVVRPSSPSNPQSILTRSSAYMSGDNDLLSKDTPNGNISLRPFKLESAALLGGNDDPVNIMIDRNTPHKISIVNITAFGKENSDISNEIEG